MPKYAPERLSFPAYLSNPHSGGMRDFCGHSFAPPRSRLAHLLNATRPQWLARQLRGHTMTTVKLSASTILTALGDVQSELVGKAVVLTDGKAGTVENIWLDELHGLRIAITGHDGKWPISTIKFEQSHLKSASSINMARHAASRKRKSQTREK